MAGAASESGQVVVGAKNRKVIALGRVESSALARPVGGGQREGRQRLWSGGASLIFRRASRGGPPGSIALAPPRRPEKPSLSCIQAPNLDVPEFDAEAVVLQHEVATGRTAVAG